MQLRRPSEQEQALDRYITDPQTPTSPNYHRWLTAQQIGNGMVSQRATSTQFPIGCCRKRYDPELIFVRVCQIVRRVQIAEQPGRESRDLQVIIGDDLCVLFLEQRIDFVAAFA